MVHAHLASPAWAATPLTGLRSLLVDWGAAVPALPGVAAAAPPVERLGSKLAWTDAVALASALTVPATTEATEATDSADVIDWARAALQRLQADCAAAFANPELLYVQQQRLMASRVAGLRERLRDKVAGRLPRLAALDAVLEQALAEHERHLLAALPACFEAWRPAHEECAAAELQRALRLELELRLQPVLGLLEALQPPTEP